MQTGTSATSCIDHRDSPTNPVAYLTELICVVFAAVEQENIYYIIGEYKHV